MPTEIMFELAQVVKRGTLWLQGLALPLWATRGLDSSCYAFEEQLDFNGDPVLSVPRRVMVQARQIATFAAASLAGDYKEGGVLALSAGRSMLTRYLAADGAAGFVFSVSRDGRVVDNRRDLYAHAFVLFSLAWLLRLSKDPLFVRALEASLDVIDRLFADPINGGYWDSLPRADKQRQQNPHMHLFEAFIALFETTRREDLLERCRRLRDLAATRFLDLKTGALRENFDDRWNVRPAPGQGRVEPGHLFEWAWLLRRYEAATGEDQSVLVEALIGMAMTKGFDRARGRIVDEIGEDGFVRIASSRSWPHTEALKALTNEFLRGTRQEFDAIASIYSRLCDVFCREDLGGGWIDHVDVDDRPISLIMPASSLYHIYFGLVEVGKLFRS